MDTWGPRTCVWRWLTWSVYWYMQRHHCLPGTGHRKVGPQLGVGERTHHQSKSPSHVPWMHLTCLSHRPPFQPGRRGTLVSGQPGQHCVARVPGTGRPAHPSLSPHGEEGASSPPPAPTWPGSVWSPPARSPPQPLWGAAQPLLTKAAHRKEPQVCGGAERSRRAQQEDPGFRMRWAMVGAGWALS